MRKQIKEITFGAMMISIIGILAVVDRQFGGGMDFLFSLFAGIPVVVFTVKYGGTSGVWLIIAATFTTFMFALPTTLIFIVSSMITGLLFGIGIKQEWPSFVVVSVTFLLKFTINFLTTVVFMEFFGYDSQTQLQLLQKLNLTSPQWLVSIEILLALITSIMETLITYIGAQTLLKRFKLPTLKNVDIYRLKMPKSVAFATMISGLSLLAFRVADLPDIIFQILIFVFVLGCFFSLFQGYLITVIWLTKNKKRKILPIAIVAVFFLPTTIAYICLGCLDAIFDFKKRTLTK